MIHVEDETPVAIWALEEWILVIRCLCCYILGLELCFVCPHMIDKQIGAHESLHGTAPSDEVLRIEPRGEGRCLIDEIECLHGDALLTLLEDVPEQGMFKRLQLPERSGVIPLPLAL